MRSILMAFLITLAGPRAWAGEFSGFYAGVNAGYAFGRDRPPVAGSGPGAAHTAAPGQMGTDLPPSAAGAAAAMRKPGPIEAGSGRR